jgi:hypothetical protein
MNMFAFSSNTSVLSYGHKVVVSSVQDVTIHEDEEASAIAACMGKGNDSYLMLSYHFIKCCGLQLNQYCYIITSDALDILQVNKLSVLLFSPVSGVTGKPEGKGAIDKDEEEEDEEGVVGVGKKDPLLRRFQLLVTSGLAKVVYSSQRLVF